MERISVIALYETVMDLARKHSSGGYASDELFNRQLKATETALLKYFYKQYEQRHEIVEHLTPFIKRVDLTTTDENGYWNLSDDFAYRLAMEGVYIVNPKTCKDPAEAICYPCEYLRTNRVATVKSSYVIYPSIEKRRFYHHYANEKIIFEPKSTYFFNPVYIRYPKYGELVQEVQSINDEDVLINDSDQSKDLEWRQITFDYFKYLMLAAIGVHIKDNPTIEYSQLPKVTGVLDSVNE